MLLKDKVIIVSGIGPGLGVKLAVEAAREGARALVIGARTAEKLEDAERRIGEVAPGCQVLKVTTDITDDAQCKRLADQAASRFGRIDALINSGFAYGEYGPFETTNLDGWKVALETNILGGLRLTQAVVPHMKKSGGGAVVMINTQSSVVTTLGEGCYATSKGGLTTAARYLARELGAYNIRVNNIRMGWMWGVPVQQALVRLAESAGQTIEEFTAPIKAQIALGRMPTDDECARAALFLVSDYASAVTGATLDANGGQFMA
ncbi:MAG: SDR family oxidoreductase [Proteobacteria bacterium]|nr:SDR family oxidoreductase [Pseudomonadota bacterium]HQR04470.1 SDR family oxidoreductase [Rhodocyclaceae bacterium]